MPRLTLAPALTAAITAVPLLLASPALASIIIDNFETGPVSLSATMPPGPFVNSNPDAAHCIADIREVYLNYFGGGASGLMSITVTPMQGVDDRLVVDYPLGDSEALLRYDGGPWDLTEGGINNRMTVKVKSVSGEVHIGVQLVDGSGANDLAVINVSQATHYQIPLDHFDDVDLTDVEEIWIYMIGDDATIEVSEITASRGRLVTLLYQPVGPRILTLLCNEPNRGSSAIGWDWTIDWPNQATLAGSELQVLGVSGPGCARVQFESDDSDPTTGPGDAGYASIDWSANTFTSADFDLRFVTNANGWYTSTLVGEPVVTQVENSFVISHSVHVENADGVPSGTVEQQVVVAPAPGQEIQLDYLDVIPLGGTSAVGYSLAFGYSDVAYDHTRPLLELYTTSGFEDDAQTTGTPLPSAALDGTLSALPSVTRGATRFSWSGDRTDFAAETLSIFDVAGRRLRELPFANGEAEWDGLDAAGRRVTTGVYFGRLEGAPDRGARVVLLR